MADIADITGERAEHDAPYILAASRKRGAPPACGQCLYCDEPLADGLRFCDANCCRDWEHEQERARVSGEVL